MNYYIECENDEPVRQTYRSIVMIDNLTDNMAHRFFLGDFYYDFEEYQSWLEDTSPYYFEGESLINYLGDMSDPNLSEDMDFYH